MKFINADNLQDALAAFRAKADAAYAKASHGTHVSYGGNGSASTVSRSDHTHNYAGSSSAGGAATSANKVNTNLTIKLNGGSTEGTNLFTFNGSTAKSINITPSAIGAAASSHGTHVTYSTTAPKVAGTAAVGSETSVARGDHVHAAQTSVSGNAGTATKLKTTRAITIGNKANNFDGSAAITYTVDDIGAAQGQYKSATTAATAQWYRIAQTSASINNVMGTFEIQAAVSGKHNVTTIMAGTSYGVNPSVQQLSHYAYSNTGISKARIVYHTTYANNYAYLEVYLPTAVAIVLSVRLTNGYGWTLIAPNTVGSVPSGYSSKEITFVNGAIVSNVTGALSGNASTATKATQDSAGQQINTTYIKGLSVSGKTITYTKGDGTTGTITTQDTNTTYSQATSSALGLVKLYTSTGTATDGTMTQSAIKSALDGKAASSHGNHVPATETANNAKFLRNDNTWQTVTPANIGAAAASHGTHLTLGTGSGNAYRGDYGNTAYTHSQAAHAPSNAQKNSDITKAEIEAKLTGAITSHTHSSITMNDCSNKDFNTIKTAGWYYGYTGMTNAPVQSIGVLEVIVYSPDWIVQRFTVINESGVKYERHYYNGNTWSTWRTIYDSKNKPTPADIGAAAESHGTHLTIGTGASNAAAGNHTHKYAGSSSAGGAATSANKVNSSLKVQLNGGTTEGTNQFTFDGSGAKTINITPSAIGAAASSHGTHLELGTTSSTAYRGDYGNTAYTHSQAAHAPSNAQKNSDITKAEIEAKLTGDITTHTHTTVKGVYTSSGGAQAPSYIAGGTVRFNMMNKFKGLSGLPTYADCILMDTYTGSDVPYVTGFGILKQSGDPRAFIAVGAKGNTTTWSKETELLTVANYKTHVTPANIGAAASSHGTHVTYSTSAPAANGTASAGSADNVARGDHVHPLQTSVSGNAGTATKLAAAKVLTIGNSGKTFDGSANVIWTLDEIGAAAKSHGTHLTIGTGAGNAAAGNHKHNYAGSPSAGGTANSVNGLTFWTGTQEEYDAIATKSETTIYMITE